MSDKLLSLVGMRLYLYLHMYWTASVRLVRYGTIWYCAVLGIHYRVVQWEGGAVDWVVLYNKLVYNIT